MNYRIATLTVQPNLVIEDEDGNLGPMPEGQQAAPLVVGLADLKGSPLYDRLILSLSVLNDPERQPENIA